MADGLEESLAQARTRADLRAQREEVAARKLRIRLTLFVVPCAYSLMARLESHKHDARLKEALQELGEIPPA